MSLPPHSVTRTWRPCMGLTAAAVWAMLSFMGMLRNRWLHAQNVERPVQLTGLSCLRSYPSRPRRLRLLVFLAPVAMVIAGCSGEKKAGQTCDFRGKWLPGRKCSYVVEVREETTTSAARRGARIASAMATSVVERVWQTVEANLSLRDEAVESRSIADFVIVSATVEREQRIKNEPPRIVRRKLNGVTGARVECTMDGNGIVTRVDGAQEFMKNVIQRGGPVANETFAAVFNEDFIEQMRITGWKHLPGEPAIPGYVWTESDKIEFPGIGRMLVRQRHRFEKWEKRGDRLCARISWWGSVGNVVETASADEVMPENVRKIESVGWCLFCPSLGMVVEWAENLAVTTQLDIGGATGAGGAATQEICRRTEVRLAGPVTDSRSAGGRLFGDKKVSAVRKSGESEGNDAKGKVQPTGKIPAKAGRGR